MSQHFWSLTGWVIAAGVLGFFTSAVFAGWLRFTRNRFLLPYVILASIFLYGFFTQNQIDIAAFILNNLGWGVLVGVLVSVLLIKNVRAQPASRQSEGKDLILEISWAGFVYGLVDAAFLNVMPVAAVWIGTSQYEWAGGFWGQVSMGLIALLGSLFVTLAYHLGYPEFRNQRMLRVLVGNTIITLAFLISGSPLGSIISHTVMHIAAVLQGPETTLQLPPHYQASLKLN